MSDIKTVVLGVSGGIAAYKMADVASTLVKQGINVYVLMTKNATNFINPITFETLTGHKCITDTFDRNFEFSVEHVALAERADVLLIAPATANIIGKLSCGIADDMVTTTAMACRCKKLIAPAMNTAMYENPVLQDNLKKLKDYGYEIIEPDTGHLACGSSGKGRLVSPEKLVEYINFSLDISDELAGKKVLVTAGPTREHFDPVRYITNHSTGKMGYAIASCAAAMGAEVTLVTGPVSLLAPIKTNVIRIETAEDMFVQVKEHCRTQDIIIKAAAVADYTPDVVHGEKLKKSEEESQINLRKTKDILAWLGDNKSEKQFICGFAMETENLIENATKKLKEKNADMIIANSLRQEGAGFGTDTNIISVITCDGVTKLPMMTKKEAAKKILKEIAKKL